MMDQTSKSLSSIHGRHRQTGFTLLEVLIALLVLSIGLLGLAALQTTGLRSNQMASMRTLATQFTYDITDRMRSNPAGVAAGRYFINRDDDPTGTSIAASDLAEWRNLIALRLPNGISDITQCDTSTTPSCAELTHVVTVYWNESRRDTSSVAATFNCPPTSDTDFRCFRLIYSE
jgi:type IV pilus assembly protein PilV